MKNPLKILWDILYYVWIVSGHQLKMMLKMNKKKRRRRKPDVRRNFNEKFEYFAFFFSSASVCFQQEFQIWLKFLLCNYLSFVLVCDQLQFWNVEHSETKFVVSLNLLGIWRISKIFLIKIQIFCNAFQFIGCCNTILLFLANIVSHSNIVIESRRQKKSSYANFNLLTPKVVDASVEKTHVIFPPTFVALLCIL